MKTNKLFRVNVEKANAIYSVFKTCNVFTILLDGTLIPVYDFRVKVLFLALPDDAEFLLA